MGFLCFPESFTSVPSIARKERAIDLQCVANDAATGASKIFVEMMHHEWTTLKVSKITLCFDGQVGSRDHVNASEEPRRTPIHWSG